LFHRVGFIVVPQAVAISLMVIARRYILHRLIFLSCHGLNWLEAAKVSMRLASCCLVWTGHVWVVLRNVILWSCSISQHLRIQPFSHDVLYAFGEWNMGLVRPDCICREPMVSRSVLETVPFSRMCPHSIRR
jgi:hypothetical protein